jgi:hypothetical protein
MSLLAEPPISAPSFLHRAIGAKRRQARKLTVPCGLALSASERIRAVAAILPLSPKAPSLGLWHRLDDRSWRNAKI